MSIIIDQRLLKFGMVGITGMAVDFTVTWLCKEKFKLNKFLSNSFGFSLAVISNFLLNRYWTFVSNQALPFQFVKFILVSLIGLLINNLLLFLLLKYSKSNFYFLKLLVIGIVFFWNYFANFLFTFN